MGETEPHHIHQFYVHCQVWTNRQNVIRGNPDPGCWILIQPLGGDDNCSFTRITFDKSADVLSNLILPASRIIERGWLHCRVRNIADSRETLSIGHSEVII